MCPKSTHLKCQSGNAYRFGTAELYEVIELCFSESTATKSEHIITDCIAVGQTIEGGADERVILFVSLLPGNHLTSELEDLIRKGIRTRRTARHVPAKVSQWLKKFFRDSINSSIQDYTSRRYPSDVER
jgi:acyl-coenzyme A synthetase/AMP-(fatty) acid ligase